MSIQYTVRDLNPQPSEHEYLPITTRPGLPPLAAVDVSCMLIPENTHLLCKGKYNCTADLLFDWFVELKL